MSSRNDQISQDAQDALAGFVRAKAAEFGIPGVAVGVWVDGREIHVCHGVTDADAAEPVPVDRDTLFQLGSVTKTYTATALMRLVAEGRVELDAPVRRYVPELVLADERAAAEITVMQLLNHTAGLDWNVITDTGDGDDALAGFVAAMEKLPLIARPGARASYSQAGFNLAGRIIEKVTGLTYEQAVTELVLRPLGHSRTGFDAGDLPGGRAGNTAAGHNLNEDGTLSVSRDWTVGRGDRPGGGLLSSVAEQLRWARFHLADGRTEGSTDVLPAERLLLMRRPTVELRGSALGDAFGICWFLREVDGVATAGHGGSTNGQFAELLIVPERDFAVVVLSNSAPNSIPFNQAVVRRVLETGLGVVDRDPEPLPYDPAGAPEIVGRYDNDAITLVIAADGEGLTLEVGIKPEIRAGSDGEMPADYPPESIGLLPGRGDEYIVTSGGLRGQRGFFTRDAAGAVVGVDLAGRLFGRVPS
ncbi:serine hydrolase domain-containing protein [Streptomyces erythrochromogenes]|uniref:serine hydrolase domain-containing protein n=1 Tax=Streptomyces erythrochromogenes TaxID=285574 RepID=UPI00367674C8